MYTRYYDNRYDPSAPVIEVTVYAAGATEQGQSLVALLDSGADATLIPIEMLHKIGAEYVTTRRIRGVLGKAYKIDLYAVALQIGTYRLDGIHAIAIERGEEEPIIGRDVLNQLVVTLNGLGEVVEIRDS